MMNCLFLSLDRVRWFLHLNPRILGTRDKESISWPPTTTSPRITCESPCISYYRDKCSLTEQRSLQDTSTKSSPKARWSLHACISQLFPGTNFGAGVPSNSLSLCRHRVPSLLWHWVQVGAQPWSSSHTYPWNIHRGSMSVPLVWTPSLHGLAPQYVCYQLSACFRMSCSRSQVLDLDSTTDTKFSRHLIFHLPNAVFTNNIHIGILLV